jgi:hypothetical protein
MKVGDKVEKREGYRWPGEVRAIFETRSMQTRVVVECSAKGVEGALHIYRPERLVVVDQFGWVTTDHDP